MAGRWLGRGLGQSSGQSHSWGWALACFRLWVSGWRIRIWEVLEVWETVGLSLPG